MIWLMIGLAWGGFLVGFVVGVWWRTVGALTGCVTPTCVRAGPHLREGKPPPA